MTGGREEDGDGARCPVPRPILNILMNRRDEIETNDPAAETSIMLGPLCYPRRSGSNGGLPIKLPSSGSRTAPCPGTIRRRRTTRACYLWPRAEGGAYVEPYARVLSVIQSVGAVLEQVEGWDGAKTTRRRIAKKLVDQDFLSFRVGQDRVGE